MYKTNDNVQLSLLGTFSNFGFLWHQIEVDSAQVTHSIELFPLDYLIYSDKSLNDTRLCN